MSEVAAQEPEVRKAPELRLGKREIGWLAGLGGLWVALFHFLGNSTFGYVDTASLFRWLSNAYDHADGDQIGYLVPFVIGGILWMRREELALVPRKPWAIGVIGLFVALLMHCAGFVIQQPRVSVVGLGMGIFFITGVVLGWRWMKATVFPMVLLGFCVPLGQMGDAVTFPLRMVVTTLAVGFSKTVLGLDVMQNGSMIYDATGSYQYDVAPACSGIRSLTALACLITVFAFIRFNSAWRRGVLIALVVPLAVLGNTARIIAVIVTGEMAGQQAGAAIEQKLGFVTFLVALGGVLLVGRWLEKGDRPRPLESRGVDSDVTVTVGSFRWSGIASAGLIILAMAFLGNWSRVQVLGKPGVRVVNEPIFSALLGRTNAAEREIAGTNSVFLPAVLPGIVSTEIDLHPSVWKTLPADTTYGQRLYRMENGQPIQTTVVLMGSDRTSIHKPEFCLVGQGFTILEAKEIGIPISEPFDYMLPAMHMKVRAERRNSAGEVDAVEGVYLFWFVADGKIAARHSTRMAWMAKDLLTRGVLQRWAYVSCFSVCPPGRTEEITAQIKRLVQRMAPRFQTSPAEGLPFEVEPLGGH